MIDEISATCVYFVPRQRSAEILLSIQPSSEYAIDSRRKLPYSRIGSLKKRAQDTQSRVTFAQMETIVQWIGQLTVILVKN